MGNWFITFLTAGLLYLNVAEAGRVVGMGPFEVEGGATLTIDLTLVPNDSDSDVYVAPTFYVEGLDVNAGLEGVLLVPKTSEMDLPASEEDFTSVPIFFVHQGNGLWAGRIHLRTAQKVFRAVRDGKPEAGYGLLLTSHRRAFKFTHSSAQRMHPSILGLSFGHALLDPDCRIRVVQNKS